MWTWLLRRVLPWELRVRWRLASVRMDREIDAEVEAEAEATAKFRENLRRDLAESGLPPQEIERTLAEFDSGEVADPELDELHKARRAEIGGRLARAGITGEIHDRERSRAFGKRHAERSERRLWEWLVRSGEGPFIVAEALGGDSSFDRSEPDYCFDRFGMTRTRLPDGRIVCIAGEHEDFYDPDFCIYNDVTVLTPAAGEDWVTETSGDVEIYTYPRRDFPPTDFHSATLVGDAIYIVGCLGYPEQRTERGQTPVYVLHLDGWRIERVKTSGDSPGWIHKHHAAYDAEAHTLIVRGGERGAGKRRDFADNRETFRLDLKTRRWSTDARRERWTTLVFRREGGEWLANDSGAVFIPERVGGTLIDFNGETGMGALDLGGVRIRIDSASDRVEMIVEGEPPGGVLTAAADEIREKLREQTGGGWSVEEKR